MTQRLQTITMGSPGFYGINSEDSLKSIDPNFASIAYNCVIDQYGRLGARKGFNVVTASGLAEIGTEPLSMIHYFEDQEGNTALFGAANNKILEFTTTTTAYDTITDATPVSYTITSDAWTAVNFNNKCYFFQRGMEPLYYDNTAGAVTKLGATVPKGHIAMAAAGRLWTADLDDNKHTLYWSSLLDGSDWTTTGGSLDMTTVWPNGYDEITGLAEINGFLVIFGRHNIVTYSGIDAPASMTVADTIGGVGCFSHNSIQQIGADVLFLSSQGLQSLGRTIQEQSLPIRGAGYPIRSEMVGLLPNETADTITSTYCPRGFLYIVTFRTAGTSYCFNLKGDLPDGSKRVTKWPGSPFNVMHRTSDCTTYVGSTLGLGTYSGYQDNGESYLFAYYSPILTFGDNAIAKVLKKIRPVLIGGSGVSATIKWGFGVNPVYRLATITLNEAAGAEYGEDEYGEDEYSGGIGITDAAINASGHGRDVTIAVEVEIDGAPFSLQEVTVYTLLGRVI